MRIQLFPGLWPSKLFRTLEKIKNTFLYLFDGARVIEKAYEQVIKQQERIYDLTK